MLTPVEAGSRKEAYLVVIGGWTLPFWCGVIGDKKHPMIGRVTKWMNACGGFSLASLMAMTLVCGLLTSGCLTTSSEDDYVAGVLAEAIQEFPPESVLSANANVPEAVSALPVEPAATTPVATMSAPAAEIVSAPVPAAPVVASAGQTISATPGAPVTVAVARPVVVEKPAPTPAPVAVPAAPAVPVVTVPAPVVVTTPAPVAVVREGGEAHPDQVIMPAEVPAAAVAPQPVQVAAGPKVVPIPAEPTIQPDSVLWVSVNEDPSLNGRYIVNDSSAIDFGYVGLVFLTDMSAAQAEGELKRVLEGRYLKTAAVSVKLAKASYDKVGVQGTVEMPGEIKIGPGATITLTEALRRAGGLRGNRENSRVKIIRGGLKTPFGPAAIGDVYSLVTRDGQLKVPEVFLRNDDLAYVFSPATDAAQGQATGAAASTGAGGKRVILLGEVPRRGVVEFAENEPCTLMYLLFKVGGLPRFARADKITVVRRNKDGSERKFQIDGEKLLNNGKPEDDLVLETGDRIVVPARKISFF